MCSLVSCAGACQPTSTNGPKSETRPLVNSTPHSLREVASANRRLHAINHGELSFLLATKITQHFLRTELASSRGEQFAYSIILLDKLLHDFEDEIATHS